MNKRIAAGLLLVLAGCTRQPDAAPVYGAGREATAEEIAAWDIDVNAAGTGLPPGQGSAAEGEVYYAGLCARCHGGKGEGTAAGSQLVRPDSATARRNIASHWPYAPPLFDYIRRAMPPDQSESYGADTLYAIVAHLLTLNGITVPGGVANAASLPQVAMPARSKFVVDDRRGGAELR